MGRFFRKFIDRHKRGFEWIGFDGLLNSETSALLTLTLMIFFKPLLSMLITIIIVFGKCTLDEFHNHDDEFHDFICACMGALFGLIIGISIGSLILL